MGKNLQLLAPALIVLVMSGCKNSETAKSSEIVQKVTNVEYYTVQPTTFEEKLVLPVIVQPDKAVNLGTTVGGKIVKIHVDKGTCVKKDQVLLDTDDTISKAQYQVAAAALEFQESEFTRNEKLFKEGSISQADFDAAKLALTQAQSTYETAIKNYEDATLEAPFGGIVTMRNVEIGDILAPGTPAFRIIDINRVKVQAGIPEKYIGGFKVGNSVLIRFDAIPGKDFEGKINYIAPEASSSIRTFTAEMVVENRQGLIKSGIMGNAQILKKIHLDALMVPLNAVIQTQNGRIAFVLRTDNTAEDRTVIVGPASEIMIKIEKGINPGDRVIVKGQHQITDGEKVRVVGESGNHGMEGTGR
jgi:RND family efflux transporter MFP subunit